MWTDMRVWKVSDVGLPADASHALHSMLKILDGRSAASWQLSRSMDADVLFVGADAGSRALDVAQTTGKIMVEVTEGRATGEGTAFSLQRPFRVIQLLDLLDSIAEHLRKHPMAKRAAHASWAPALSLLEATAQASPDWRVASTGDGGQLWLDKEYVVASEQTMQRLRSEPMEISSFVPSLIPPPSEAARCAVTDLGWYLGWQGTGQMPPWLNEHERYQLRRWPDFGRLGAQAMMLELCAEAAAHPVTHAELAERTRCSPAQAYRFLAAASLAGWLVAQGQAQPRAQRAVRPSSWARLVSQLRRHLA